MLIFVSLYLWLNLYSHSETLKHHFMLKQSEIKQICVFLHNFYALNSKSFSIFRII